MTVMQLISSEGFYGAESMLVTLAEAQQRAGVRASIAVFDDARVAVPDGVAEKAAALGIETHQIPCSGRVDLSAVHSLRALLKQQHADILHCHGYKADLYGLAAARRHGIALVSTCHNWPDRRPVMRAYAAADRFALRWFDHVTTPSQQVARILERSGVASSKVTVIANGVDVERFQGGATRSLRQDIPGAPRYLIGLVGRLVSSKGGAVFLHAARAVLAVCPEAAFVFVGEGPCREEWGALADRLGIGERVSFVGTRSDMPGVYASLDVLALPSFDEAMPMCLLEALAAGCPVVATNVGEVPAVIRHGITGLLIEPRDEQALAKAILQTLLDPVSSAQRVALGRAMVERTYSSAAMERSYLDIYERALSTRTRTLVAAEERMDSA
jgi:glycosyltransferase involved in cell wall biosynthesis